MRSFFRAVVIVLLSCFSNHLTAQPIVELRWDITTGNGTTGSNSIAAEKGDQLSLLIIVRDKSTDGIGLLGAALSATYDTNYLEPIRFHECPNPPNSTAGLCNDLFGTLFEPYLPGFFASPGLVYNFDAYSVKNKAGYFNNNDDEMALARLNFRVGITPTETTDVLNTFYDPVSGEAIVDGHNMVWQPTANATIRPPPCSGCGCPP